MGKNSTSTRPTNAKRKKLAPDSDPISGLKKWETLKAQAEAPSTAAAPVQAHKAPRELKTRPKPGENPHRNIISNSQPAAPKVRQSLAIPNKTPLPTPPTRKLPIPLIVVGTAFAFTLSFYTASAYNTITHPPDPNLPLPNLTAVYNKTAEDFDHEVDSMEYWWGIMKLRRKMVKQARGHVLESAAGTGRNSEFYSADRIRGLCLVDKSEGMLEVCRRKWADTLKSKATSQSKGKDDGDNEDDPWQGKVSFAVADIENPGVDVRLLSRTPSSQGFDTIIQTMALCSTDNPTRLLSSLSALLHPTGRILLLEHGQGFFGWLNKLLSNTAPQHAARHGCWWDRNIGRIAEESCEECGLEVVEIRRPWQFLGTTWWVELKRTDAKGIGSSSIVTSEAITKSP